MYKKEEMKVTYNLGARTHSGRRLTFPSGFASGAWCVILT